MAFGPLFSSAFAVVFLLWLGLSLYALGNRMLYDLRHRSVRIARRLLSRASLRAAPREERRRHVEKILTRLPRRTIDHVAADSSAPPWLAEAFSVFALERWGEERLVRDASAHRGEVSRWRRVAALRILAQARHPELLALLGRALSDADPQLVGTAVGLLGRVPDPRAARLLVDALKKKLYSASRIATSLDQFPLEISDLLVELLSDSAPHARFWGAALLARYAGRQGLDGQLAALADDPDPNVRKAAVESLGRIGGPAAASTALRLLDDPIWYVKAHAARALGDLGRLDATPRLVGLLADTQWWVRLAAKEALEALGPEVWPQLVPCLDHPDAFARNGAAEVLQNLGVLDALLDALARGENDPESQAVVKKAAAAGGGRLTEGLLERAEPEAAARIRGLLSELGFEAAGESR